ncbi:MULTISPECIES: fimbrial protein [Klebsiella]|uniref:fimbrial protein n=1 Tax=Klebsiella TaxID=570 RepID=UPI000DD45E4F|nr:MULTISPECIES: type 1 fimbrial protein [Klebsiella]MBZ7661746.1 type 1 fimbrial protein [Klebsiella grimontii]VUS98078.1 Fimbria A protein [Klebsiella pasteurii]
MKKGFGRTTLMLWLLTAGIVSVADAANWDVDGLNGGLRATGTLVASPCVLLPESAEQHLDLGRTVAWGLEQPGSTTSPVLVYIKLDRCPGEFQYMRDHQLMRGSTMLNGQSAVKMTIYGEVEPTDGRFFRVHGGVEGVALRLSDRQGELLRPGMQSRPQILNPGRNDLVFQAQLWRLPAPLMANEWRSVMNIGLEYE